MINLKVFYCTMLQKSRSASRTQPGKTFLTGRAINFLQNKINAKNERRQQ